MKQLNLDNLRALVAVIDLGGYARAGEYLGRSQPAISLQIKKLENQLNRKLFYKSGQRQLANADGLALYQQAKAMLDINDDIFRQFEPPSLRGRLRLGIPSEFAITLLPSIVGEFCKMYPDVTLEVTSALSKSLLSEDHRQDYDLIVALVNPEQTVDAELLLDDDLVWVGSKQQPVTSDTLQLVLAPDGCVYRSRVISKLKQQTVRWRISYTHADLTGISAAIHQGLGITALCKSTVPADLTVVRHPLLPELGQIKICLFNQSRQYQRASATFANFIQTRLGASNR